MLAGRRLLLMIMITEHHLLGQLLLLMIMITEHHLLGQLLLLMIMITEHHLLGQLLLLMIMITEHHLLGQLLLLMIMITEHHLLGQLLLLIIVLVYQRHLLRTILHHPLNLLQVTMPEMRKGWILIASWPCTTKSVLPLEFHLLRGATPWQPVHRSGLTNCLRQGSWNIQLVVGPSKI